MSAVSDLQCAMGGSVERTSGLQGPEELSLEFKEQTWEDLDEEGAVLPEFRVDEWETTSTKSKAVHSWKVESKDDEIDFQRRVFVGFSMKIHIGTRRWKKPPRYLKTQLREACKSSGDLESLVYSLALRCDEITGLLLVLSLFSKWEFPEIAGLDDMIRYLIIPIVIVQKKEQLLTLAQKHTYSPGRESKIGKHQRWRQRRLAYLRTKPTKLKYSVDAKILEILSGAE